MSKETPCIAERHAMMAKLPARMAEAGLDQFPIRARSIPDR
jgi:hypothetical protein